MTTATKVASDTASADSRILAIDIGGSGLKAALLDYEGKMLGSRVRVENAITPYSHRKSFETIHQLGQPARDG